VFQQHEDEKELMRIDGVAQSENIDGLVNSLTHIKGKDRAIKHILNLVINYVLYPKKRFNSPIVNG
jgi:hypothetical protein